MIKELMLIRTEGSQMFRDPALPFRYLCRSGVRRYFNLPKDVTRITLYTSDSYVEGATEANVKQQYNRHHHGYLVLNFDRKRPVIVSDMARWFPQGKFWFWIEYEETSS